MTPQKTPRSLRWLVLAPLCLAGLATLSAQTQTAPASDTPKTSPRPVATAPKPSSDEEVVVMSPFEVKASNTGYFAANSMSGTRLNTQIQDLASPITVVTTGQMDDFAMLDLNDIFLYTANTEGTGTYTDVTIDRNGQLTDNSQGNPTMANRVRGIAAANISYGNYEMMGRTPVDPLIVDGVEISRGPNASVFGLGNPSGTVNQVPVAANMSRNRTRVQLRGDSYGGWRSTFDVNQVIWKNKLALRVNGGKQLTDSVRGPTGFNEKRLDVVMKFRPFKYTTLTAGYLYYYGFGNRPNNTMPRDYVSAWQNAGEPGWDPSTQLITVNGTTYGADAAGTAATHLVAGSTTPIAIPSTSYNFFLLPRASGESDVSYNARRALTFAGGAFQRSNIFVDQSGVSYWTAPTDNTAGTPTANGGSIRLAGPTSSTLFGASVAGRFDSQPLFTTTPTVSGKSIYDWSSINLSAIDQFGDRTRTYHITLDQTFFNTAEQNLTGMVGFFREDADRYRRTPASNSGTSGQTGQLWVDVNLRNLDGTPNPNFGRPFIGIIEPRTFVQPAEWDTYRAQLAYSVDLTHRKSWLRWFGSQQLSGYYDYKYRINRQYAYRDVMTSDTAWTVAALDPSMGRANQGSITGGPQVGPNIMRGFFRYYVGGDNHGQVQYAPSSFNYGSYPFVWGTTNNWHYDPMALGQMATTDGTGGTSNLKQILKTPGALLLSHWFNDRLVTTVGIRKDYVYSKNGFTPQQLVDNNTQQDFTTDNHWSSGDYNFNSGRTKQIGIVARPFRDMDFVSRWSQTGTGLEQFVGDLLHGLALTYNQSDNFYPQPPAVDLYLHQLPNITGKGKDFGFWLTLFSDKLVVRFNRYENSQFNARNGDANTVAQRVLRHDLDTSGDGFRLYYQATNWVAATNQTWDAQRVQAEVFNEMHMTQDRYNGLVANFQSGTIAATNDITGKGNELEINYNPTKFWTLSANATDTRSINSNVSSTVQQYIDERLPIWTTIQDPRFANLPAGDPNRLWWTNNTYGGSQTAAANYASFVDAPWSVLKASQGKSLPSVRRYNFRLSTNYDLAGITDNRILKNFSVGGAVRWEDKGAIDYYGVNWQQAMANNQSITQLDPNNPIWDKAHTYFDAFIGYKLKLFSNKVSATIRLNARNLQEGGRLQAIHAFPDGTPSAYRIVDPREFILTVTFDL